jgi:hypothetical protein
MAGDGIKTNKNRRARSQRNKIVSTLTGAATVAAAAETAIPGILPPGSGVLTAQLLTFAALIANQFWPQ